MASRFVSDSRSMGRSEFGPRSIMIRLVLICKATSNTIDWKSRVVTVVMMANEYMC